MRNAALIALAGLIVGTTLAQGSLVNWENPPGHPLDMTPDGSTLLAVNTADDRLEVFQIGSGGLMWVQSIPVGVDPVTVRARTNTEVWVVNHISDSVSIVDLTTGNVVWTLKTLDEPYDVVFAGTAGRAFVSCSQPSVVQVFDPANLAGAPISIEIDAEEPRTMAVSPDGGTVYVAIFESGNGTTILGGGADGPVGTLAYPPNVVSDPAGPYGGVNPPPNDGAAFDPPLDPNNPPPPRVGLIVRKQDDGTWLDDNGGDWTNLVSGPQASLSGRPVGWDLPDRDIAVIDAETLTLSYITRLMNINMAIAVNPASGDVSIVGTEAFNEVRFEPNVNGRFIHVNVALVDPASGAASIVDLNPHLDYSSSTIPQTERVKSIGDPRGIVWNAAGSRAYVTGMGSNNVVVIDSAGARAGLAETIPVGQGPTGIALDESRGRLYVLNRFDASISIIDTATEMVSATIGFYDPTPEVIRVGRPHLYDTHRTSGLGHISCASCHVDARIDRLAWDLGDPQGDVIPLTGQNLGAGIFGLTPGTTNPPFAPHHPMKGPMTTQTLQDIIGHEPHHWRGDRRGIEEFNPAFVGLLGDDQLLTPLEMQEFEDFLATITFPPNPFRNFDNTLPSALPLPGHFTPGRFGPAGQPLPVGNPQAGLTLYRSTSRRLDGNAFACATCHTLPTGTGPNSVFTGGMHTPLPPGPLGEAHHMLVSVDGSTNRAFKTPQLRNLYDKVGFEATQVSNRAGFGFLHDGSVDSIARFVSEPVFDVRSDQEVADLVAFLLCFSGSDLPAGIPTNLLLPPGTASQDSHAAVGAQTTVVDSGSVTPDQLNLILSMVSQADQGRVGLIIKGRQGGIARGYSYAGGGMMQSDRLAEQVSYAALISTASAGNEITFTVVPLGTEIRAGIDRDEDGYYDRDELDACTDPADPNSFPGGPGGLVGDLDGDGMVGFTDLVILLGAYGSSAAGDLDNDGDTDFSDLVILLANYGMTCP